MLSLMAAINPMSFSAGLFPSYTDARAYSPQAQNVLVAFHKVLIVPILKSLKLKHLAIIPPPLVSSRNL